MKTIAALLAALAIVLSGCGGSGGNDAAKAKPLSKDAYGKALVDAARNANRDGQSAMNEIRAGKPNGVADLKRSMATFHERLAGIQPPEDAQAEHERLVTASAQLAKEFAAAVDKQQPKTYASLRPLTNMTRYKGGQKVLRVTAELDAKGYDLG